MIGGAGLLGGPTHGSPPSAGTRSPPGLAAPAGRREPAFRDEDRAWKRSGDERRRAACPSRRLYVNARSAGRSPRPTALPKGYWPDATDCPPSAPAPNGKMPPLAKGNFCAAALERNPIFGTRPGRRPMREEIPAIACKRPVRPKKGDPKFSAGRLSSDANPALETAQTGA